MSRRTLCAALATAMLAPLAFTRTAMASGAVAALAPKPDHLIVRTWGGPWRTTYQESAAASFSAKTGNPRAPTPARRLMWC